MKSSKLVEQDIDEQDTKSDDLRIDEQGVEDAEIIDDDEDLEQIQRTKMQYQVTKFNQEQKMILEKQQMIQASPMGTPLGSAYNSKVKDPQVTVAGVHVSSLINTESETSNHKNPDPNAPESVTPSAINSKNKAQMVNLEVESVEKLRERLQCIMCMNNPKCMMI